MNVEVEHDALVAALRRRSGELERSERRFRDVIEHTADAILVVDRAGVVRFANLAAREMFAGRRDELVGTHFGFPVVVGETTELDLLSGGTPRLVEMRVMDSEWEGAPARIASLRDITERREAEERARRLIREHTAREAAERSAHTLRFLVDATTRLSSSLDYATILSELAQLCVARIADWTVVYTVDDAGHPQRAEVAHCQPGHEQLTGELQRMPVGRQSAHAVVRALRTHRPEVVHDVSDDALAAMTSTPRELALVRALGVRAFVIVPMTARGRAFGALALVSSGPHRRFTDDDVTLMADIAARAALAIDNARLYAEAQRANQSKTDFLAVVSHDLRTPLNAIIGFADLLNEGIPRPLPGECLESVQRIRTSARHLMYLLNELLMFARLDGGSEQLHRGACDLCAVARDVAAVMERLAQERGLSFRLVVPEAPVDADTDPDKLRQVLLNLVSNAVKYTRRGSVVLELSGGAGADAVFTIRDSGIGIAPEHLERIFEPFWQVESTERGRGDGTGLGLSVVRRLVQLLGGEVRVTSEVGQGTTFVVRVPRSAPAQIVAGAPG